MSVKLLTVHRLEFRSLKGGCTGLSKSTLVKMPHCWKSHVAAHIKLLVENSFLLSASPLVSGYLPAYNNVGLEPSRAKRIEKTMQLFLPIILSFSFLETECKNFI